MVGLRQPAARTEPPALACSPGRGWHRRPGFSLCLCWWGLLSSHRRQTNPGGLGSHFPVKIFSWKPIFSEEECIQPPWRMRSWPTAAPVLLCHLCPMMDHCWEEAHRRGRSCPQACISFLAMLWAKCSLSHTGLQLFLWFEPRSVDVICEGHSSARCRDGQEAWMWSIMGGVPEEAASWRRRKRRRAGRGHHCLLGATWAAVQGCPTG